MKRIAMIAAALILALFVQANAAEHSYPEARPFTAAPHPKAQAAAAQARAAVSGKYVMLIFGVDDCHDSRGLAGWFATPRFAAMLAARFEIVWIDVGPDRQQHRNLARRYGVAPIVGTPTVLVLNSRGQAVNRADAVGWRNAASRSEDEIFAYFATIGATQ